MKNERLAQQILEYLGGTENIESITHCATRLRPSLKKRELVQSEKIELLDGVTGVVNKDSGYQIIIGTNVGEVYEDFLKVLNRENNETTNEKNSKVQTKKSLINEFVQLVVSIFSPLLPLLAGSGLLRGFTILANEVGILSTDSSTNLMLTLAIAVAGALIMPDFINLIQGDGGNTISFFGLPVPVFNYTSQILPAIFTTWVQSKMEHFMKKTIPNSLHMILIPTVLLFVLVPVTASIFGPLGNYISIGIAGFVNYLAGINQIITGAITGGIWNILIMFGVHWAPNTMVIIPEIASTGHSPFIAYGATANFGMAGAAFAVFLRSKNTKLRNFSLTAITSVFLSGIVEPAIYGLGVKFKTPLIAGCLGAAMGGAFMGAFNVIGNAFVFGGLTTIPAFAGPTLWAYIVGLVIAFFGGMILTIILGIKDPEAEMK